MTPAGGCRHGYPELPGQTTWRSLAAFLPPNWPPGTASRLDSGRTWRDEWPPRSGPDAAPDRLPRAVEFRFELGDLGPIQRLVELPDPPLPPGSGGLGGQP